MTDKVFKYKGKSGKRIVVDFLGEEVAMEIRIEKRPGGSVIMGVDEYGCVVGEFTKNLDYFPYVIPETQFIIQERTHNSGIIDVLEKAGVIRVVNELEKGFIVCELGDAKLFQVA